jgi:hypothetical protein
MFSSTSIAANTTTTVPSGDCANVSGLPQAVNGGYQLSGSSATFVRATSTAPDVQYGTTASRWLVQFTNGGPYSQQITIWVLCASGTGG